MSLSCLPTDTSYDIQCPICGCGFLLLTAPMHVVQSASLRLAARSALAYQHHSLERSRTVHPDGVFDLNMADRVLNHFRGAGATTAA